MLISFFHFIQGGFEAFYAMSQAAMYVTTATNIIYYNR